MSLWNGSAALKAVGPAGYTVRRVALGDGRFTFTLERRGAHVADFETERAAKAAIFRCPTCRREGALSLPDVVRGYQCLDCTRKEES